MLLESFDPPGFVDDLSAADRIMWSNFISDGIDEKIKNIAGHHFYNPIHVETTTDVAKAEISWTAFPRIVSVHSPSDKIRWQRADGARGVQDEYCEWSVTRDGASQKIKSVTFTCEGPEYWNFLARQDPGKALAL